ncbi:hypothetical protein PAECIP111802_02298 [Paenibacillus allorhizosphaerae]|uniref:Uncharacterized protein n=1 Tax=Paenibacillus allorhizosphaerae TaxID=2849866 RepID=A0ABM8VG08_9BACL|nr:hypothetical protein PAECIP111802_02298 [Paenibacillus allorhizosphaerae]
MKKRNEVDLEKTTFFWDNDSSQEEDFYRIEGINDKKYTSENAHHAILQLQISVFNYLQV